MEFYFQSNSVMNSLESQSHWATVSLNYSQSNRINLGPSDGGTIVPLTHHPTVLNWRLSDFWLWLSDSKLLYSPICHHSVAMPCILINPRAYLSKILQVVLFQKHSFTSQFHPKMAWWLFRNSTFYCFCLHYLEM